METQLIVPFTERPCHRPAATPPRCSAAQESKGTDQPKPSGLWHRDSGTRHFLHLHGDALTLSESKRAEQGRTYAFPSAGFSCPDLHQAGGSSWIAVAFSRSGWQLSLEQSSPVPLLYGFCVLNGDRKAEKLGTPDLPRPPAGPLLFLEPANVSIAL